MALPFALVLFANAPLLDDFARLAKAPELASASEDAPTHFFRIEQARDLYLPSGHRLGWEPFWYQGYVPFLLYPHLPYGTLALLSLLVPLDLARLFNVATMVAYFSLPIVAAAIVSRSSGWIVAAVVASWFSVLSTFGAGLKGVFEIGLFNQQLGVVLFVVFAHRLVVDRRVDRAAIWLGLLPLVHVHSAVVAAALWLAAGGLAASGGVPSSPRSWLRGSVLALLVASPFLFGIAHGHHQIGRSMFYGDIERFWWRLVAGGLFAPWATLLAIALGVVAGARFLPSGERRAFAVFTALATAVTIASLHRWEIGWRPVDDVVASMLYLRGLPFAFVLFAMLAAAAWKHVPMAIRATAGVLSLLGIVLAWQTQAVVAPLVGISRMSTSEALPGYDAALDWIAAEAGDETSTLAIAPPRSRSYALVAAVRRTRLPLLEGHGEELTAVHNADFVERLDQLPCEQIRTKIDDYGIGFVAGTDENRRRRLARCLGMDASFDRAPWWVFATGRTWAASAEAAGGFAHDETWTELRWTLDRSLGERAVRLPVANTAPWAADVDGRNVAIASTGDGMMRVSVPDGGEVLTLRYRGYAGEWLVLLVSAFAWALAVRDARRAGT